LSEIGNQWGAWQKTTEEDAFHHFRRTFQTRSSVPSFPLQYCHRLFLLVHKHSSTQYFFANDAIKEDCLIAVNEDRIGSLSLVTQATLSFFKDLDMV
jgi:hypothetical protein